MFKNTALTVITRESVELLFNFSKVISILVGSFIIYSIISSKF